MSSTKHSDNQQFLQNLRHKLKGFSVKIIKNKLEIN